MEASSSDEELSSDSDESASGGVKSTIQHVKLKTARVGEFTNCSRLFCGRVMSAAFVELSESPDQPWPRCKQCFESKALASLDGQNVLEP